MVTVLLYDGVNAVDVTGPTDALASVRTDQGESGYALTFWSFDGRYVAAESGLKLCPDAPADPETTAHILLVPGGRGVREDGTLAALSTWLRAHHMQFETVVSVCTGAYALAEAGLLDGRRVTTHWAHACDFRRRYPKVDVDADALFIQDGRFLTSGGVTAGIDLALELIARDFGHEASAAVAREMVVFTRRSGKQSQFSAPLRLMARAPDRLAERCRWAANHPDADLSVEALARHALLSPRHFSRRFRAVYGEPPATFVKRLRIDGARILLEQGVSVGRTAPAVGFATVDGLRRAFERALGVTPLEYQRRFRAPKDHAP